MGSLDWAHLPDELLESILQRLPSASDYMRFSIVCRSWYFVAKKNLREHSAPMLLTFSGEEQIWNLCDMTNQRVLDLQLELPNTRFCGFSKGWLITMDKNFIVSLIDPFSKIMGRRVRRPTTEDSTITLPPLHPPEMSNERYRTHWTKSNHYEYFLDKAIISADPFSNKKESMVVVIYSVHGLAYIKLAQDTSWTYIDAGIAPCLKNIVYYKDKLYAIDNRGQVFSCDLSTGQLNLTLIVQGFEPPTRIITNGYILEPSDGRGLLMVYRYMKVLRRGRHRSRQSVGQFRGRGRQTIEFKVFKLDIYDHKLVDIDSLDDVILFLGDSAISVMASKNIPECEPNCIYFIHDHDSAVAQNILGVSCFDRLHDFGVYDLTDRGFWFFEGEGAAIPIKMSTRTPVWVMANIKL